MNPEKEDIQLIVKKFKWINNKKISVINNEGIEKVIYVFKVFDEVASSAVPFVDLDYLKNTQTCQYYY